MARPNAVGISYFPLDTSFLRDVKIRRVLKACGATSIAVTIALLTTIYEEEGYFIEYNEDLPFVIADNVGITEGSCKETINKLIQVGFFDEEIFEKYKVLTSRSIQKRYLKACERRKEVKIIYEIFLLDFKKYENIVYVDINGVNVDINRVDVYKSTQREIEREIEIEIERDKVSLKCVNQFLKNKIQADSAYKLNNIDLNKFLDELKQSTWLRDNFDITKSSDNFIAKILKGDYRDYSKSGSKLRFKNFTERENKMTNEDYRDRQKELMREIMGDGS